MNDNSILQTSLDQIVSSEQGQLIKAILPYLPNKPRQMLSILAKTQELQNTIALFSSEKDAIQTCSEESPSMMEMLQDLRKFSYGKSRQQIDQIFNIIAMTEILQLIQEYPEKEE